MGTSFFKTIFEHLVGIKPENRKRTSCSKTKLDFLRVIHSFPYQNQVSSFFPPWLSIFGGPIAFILMNLSIAFWGLGLCVAHQDIAGRDALHENTSGACAGDSENVLV